MPLTVVAPAQISEVVIVGAAVVATITVLETELMHLPVAVAYAVIASLADNADTVAVQEVPLAITVTVLDPLT